MKPRPLIRPLAAIPHKEGALIVGIRKDGAEASLTVYIDASGFYTVPGAALLIGWRWPS